jgi:hypothetical protein
LEPFQINNLGGLQSYAFGQHDGKWLIIGGRLDGLHRRQPFAAFDVAGNNNQIIIVDPTNRQKWSSSLSSLPISIREQLSSTNMEFHQDGNYLYLLGGYGYQSSTDSKVTFGKLVAIDIPAVINAILNGNTINTYFRQINDNQFAVTGGHLKKIGNTYYLIGGNKFDGDYNPMERPTYTQVYTNSIRKFNLIDDGNNIDITHLPSVSDNVNLHRRDFNAVSQIMPNGKEGITAFSGVFQPSVNLPYLNCVNIDSSSYGVNPSFSQYYNHYHCAVLPLFSESNNEMHTVFFGGIARYYDQSGTLVQDNNVPFVKTIARVSRSANGDMAEYKLPIEMPSLLGTGSEFIPVNNLPQYQNQVIKLDELVEEKNHVGYIYGGISSSSANIFFTNDGTESSASNQIFKVFVHKVADSQVHLLNEQSIGTLQMQVYPNPNHGEFVVRFHLNNIGHVKFILYDILGKKLEEKILTNLVVGENIYKRKIRQLTPGGTYIVSLETPIEKAVQKIIISN